MKIKIVYIFVCLLLFLLAGCKKEGFITYEHLVQEELGDERNQILEYFLKGELWDIRLMPKDNNKETRYFLHRTGDSYRMRGVFYRDSEWLDIPLSSILYMNIPRLDFSENSRFSEVITVMDQDRTRNADHVYMLHKRTGDTLYWEGNSYADRMIMIRVDPVSNNGLSILEDMNEKIRMILQKDFLNTPFFEFNVEGIDYRCALDLDKLQLWINGGSIVRNTSNALGLVAKLYSIYGDVNGLYIKPELTSDTLFFESKYHIYHPDIKYQNIMWPNETFAIAELDRFFYDQDQKRWYVGGTAMENNAPIAYPISTPSPQPTHYNLASTLGFIAQRGVPKVYRDASIDHRMFLTVDDLRNGLPEGWSAGTRNAVLELDRAVENLPGDETLYGISFEFRTEANPQVVVIPVDISVITELPDGSIRKRIYTGNGLGFGGLGNTFIGLGHGDNQITTVGSTIRNNIPAESRDLLQVVDNQLRNGLLAGGVKFEKTPDDEGKVQITLYNTTFNGAWTVEKGKYVMKFGSL